MTPSTSCGERDHHAVLTAARAIYAATGFTIAETWTHDEFGKAEVSETWRLKL